MVGHGYLSNSLPQNFEGILRYDLQRLLTDISEQKNLENLCTRLAKNEVETLAWLNRVINFVFEANPVNLLNTKHAILPNQYGDFQLKTKLIKDDNIPEGLKDVLFLVGEDWREELLHLGIKCNLERSKNIRDTSERISAIINKQKHPKLREATYLLISYIPDTVNTKQIVKPNFLEKRNQIWEFAKALDKDVPETKKLSNWIPSLWNICDEWILETLIRDIANLQRVSVLRDNLEKMKDLEAVDWLSRFINFLNKYKKKSLYSEQPIFPNQQGNFNKKADLLFDNNIPEQLKDTLEKLGSDCRGKLLHRNILNFEKSLKPFSVTDISKEIDEIIKDEDRNKSEDFQMGIYALISYFKTGTQDENRLNIWQITRDIYADIIPEKTFLENLQEFSWEECNKWIVKSIVEKIAQTNNLANLMELLSQNRERTIIWLNNVLCFIYNFDERLLDNYHLMPTQNKELKKRKELKRDGGIPEELKEIARYLRLEEWNDFLLLNNAEFAGVQKLIDEKFTVEQADIAREIDNAIKEYEADKQDNNFREVVKQLLHWSSLISESDFKRQFTYFYDHRAEIVLQTLGDDKVRSNIFDVLQSEPEKLDALAQIARNSNITAEDLHKLSENSDRFKALEILKEKLNVGVEKEIVKFLEEFGIDLPSIIQQEPDSKTSKESSSRYSQESFSRRDDDGSSYAENAEKYGQRGEYWARRLYEEYLEYTILPNDDSGFDLLCAKEGSEQLRVEVKAITFNRPFIRITANEWEKMVIYKNNYELLIFSHDKGTPQEFIRVKTAWQTFIDILACLKKQPQSYASYASSELESLISLQLKSTGKSNDIIINWKRFFKMCQHSNIHKYQYNESSGFEESFMD